MDMHHSPWSDTSRFQMGEKSKLINLIKAKFETLSSEQIMDEFNVIVNEKLFYNGASVENYPVCP
jgi:hypothetical protein